MVKAPLECFLLSNKVRESLFAAFFQGWEDGDCAHGSMSTGSVSSLSPASFSFIPNFILFFSNTEISHCFLLSSPSKAFQFLEEKVSKASDKLVLEPFSFHFFCQHSFLMTNVTGFVSWCLMLTPVCVSSTPSSCSPEVIMPTVNCLCHFVLKSFSFTTCYWALKRSTVGAWF